MNHTLSITNNYGHGYYQKHIIYFEYYIMNLEKKCIGIYNGYKI